VVCRLNLTHHALGTIAEAALSQLNAVLQGVHEIDDVVRPRAGLRPGIFSLT
jgi:hypothetical protein